MNTPESPDSPVMNTPGSGLLGVLYWLSMLLNIGKRLPRCPKQWGVSTPSSEYTGESQLPSREYIRESWLPCDEYTSKSTSWCTLNKHQNRFTKKLSGDKQFWSQDSPMYSSQGSPANLMYLPRNNFRSLKYSWSYLYSNQFPGEEYTGESIRIPK
jgi:hypothetical protein